MSNKITNTGFVGKVVSELSEFVRYLIGIRSKADKKALRAELAAECATLNATITAQKADSNSKISTLTSVESAHNTSHNKAEEALDANIKDDELTIAHAFEKVRAAVGMEENGEVVFEDTNYLDSCTTIKEALIALDNAIANL